MLRQLKSAFPPRLSRSLAVAESAAKNPTLRPNLFAAKSLPTLITHIPLSTYPNPLFNLPKTELVGLSDEELGHLLRIPYKSASETDKFCLNVIEIANENILLNPAVAARFLHAIHDLEMEEIVVGCLMHYYKKDRLRRSVLRFITDPGSRETHHEILDNLSHILAENPDLAAQIVLQYLRKLALTGSVNPNIILLPPQHLRLLMAQISATEKAELYACLFHTNIKFREYETFEQLKKSLLGGSHIEKTVARTGILDAKWHDTNRFSFEPLHREKMGLFFTFNDLVFFAQHAINEKDVVAANLYLELLVAKFETTTDISNHTKQLQKVLSVILSHSMRFVGPQECLKFLRYMVESAIQVRPATLLQILCKLRAEGCHEEALLLINFLHTTKLQPAQRRVLVNEIMLVISARFSLHPQVAAGYFASLFSSSDDAALQILKDLGILDLIYGPDAVRHLFECVERADIHNDLKGAVLTHDVVREMYCILLRNLPGQQKSNSVLIKHLFSRYMAQVVKARELGNTSSIFHPSMIDDSIICVFMDHLLRKDPSATADMDLNADKHNYACATSIWTEFFGQVTLDRKNRKPYLVDLMVTSALLKHRDLKFAAHIMKHSREAGLPLSFNQLFPFIMHHYSRGEYDHAHRWYTLLVRNGVKAKSVAADRLFEIAKELQWEVKGSVYKNSGHAKNKQARKEMARLDNNPLRFLNKATAKENVDDTTGGARDVNLLEELGSLLNAVPKV